MAFGMVVHPVASRLSVLSSGSYTQLNAASRILSQDLSVHVNLDTLFVHACKQHPNCKHTLPVV